METDTMNFGAILTYALLMLFMFVAGSVLGQNMCNSDICVVQFNASWIQSNSVDFLEKLTDCEIMNVNIDEGTYQSDYKIVVVPTIIVFTVGCSFIINQTQIGPNIVSNIKNNCTS